MIKSIYHFFLKNNNVFFLLHKNQPPGKHAKWPLSDLTPWTLTLIILPLFVSDAIRTLALKGICQFRLIWSKNGHKKSHRID